MRKLIERLLIFFVGAPLVLSSIYFLPQYNFLVYHIEMIIAGIIATWEIYNILSQRVSTFPKTVVCGLGLIAVISSYLVGLGIVSPQFLFIIIGLILPTLFFAEFLFSFGGNFTKSIARLCSGIFMFVYPWGFILYVSATTNLEHAAQIILSFYLMVFVCDSFAWFFGMVFGRQSRGFIKASPKKSIVGFIGGFLGSVSVAFLITNIFESIFGAYLIEWIIIAVLTSVFAILGDIVESILKRSAGLKDSGNVVMGRGGVLDSIDSILMAAPIFYFSYQLLIGGGF